MISVKFDKKTTLTVTVISLVIINSPEYIPALVSSWTAYQFVNPKLFKL
jgi:hypothetical protein